jgi:orotidine-5'-phosphate decarboxylase
MPDDKRIIVALDMESTEAALELADQLDPALCRVKIGNELFTRTGPSLVRELNQRNFDIFLDLKFHDIPNTVARAVEAAAELGVWMLTLHASGGVEMMKAARDVADRLSKRPLLVAVTVLTSMNDADLEQQGVQRSTLEHVQRLAALAQNAGMDGVVCSAAEAADLRKLLSKDFVLVTPGIRPAGDPVHDQKRVFTPTDAIRSGSTYLVIGRPITRSRHPGDRLAEIQRQLLA